MEVVNGRGKQGTDVALGWRWEVGGQPLMPRLADGGKSGGQDASCNMLHPLFIDIYKNQAQEEPAESRPNHVFPG